MADVLTVGAAAKVLGVPEYTLRRVFTDGLLPEPERAGRYRLIPEAQLPSIREALRRRGRKAPCGAGRAAK